MGLVVTWVLCIFLKNVVGGELNDYQFRFSAFGIVIVCFYGNSVSGIFRMSEYYNEIYSA